MIFVDKNKTPERTVFYMAAVLSHLIHEESKISYEALYQKAINIVPYRATFSQDYILALDFLFIVGIIDVDDKGFLNAIN